MSSSGRDEVEEREKVGRGGQLRPNQASVYVTEAGLLYGTEQRRRSFFFSFFKRFPTCESNTTMHAESDALIIM